MYNYIYKHRRRVRLKMCIKDLTTNVRLHSHKCKRRIHLKNCTEDLTGCNCVYMIVLYDAC